MDSARVKIIEHLFLVADFCLSVSVTALSGKAHTGHYRTRLWEAGGDEGWNSDPRQRIYDYANYREPPEIPLIWSQRLTDQSLGVALLSLLFVLARIIMGCSGQMSPFFSATYDSILLVLWMINFSAQISGDLSDPNHPSPRPWYLTRSCEAASGEAATACRVSRASLLLTLLILFLYAGRLVLTSAYWVKERRQQRAAGYERITVKLDLLDDDEESQRDSAERERERYMYREALSPVLAFFPEDAR